jgi:hypothetical protein
VNGTSDCPCQRVPAIQTLKIRTFMRYPMDALTERA